MNDLRESLMLDPLTDREKEILRLLAEGLTNREIAERLILSLETIKWYNRQIYSKLDVNNRTQAVARSHELGLFVDAVEAPISDIPAAPHNLPAELTSFVGREREIAEVQQLLKVARLVTLTGAGGTGKTRLGLQIARSAARYFPDGVIFVGLASATDPNQVPKAIAHELGIIERPDRPLVESLQRYLRDKYLLMVLDSFEHVVEAAPLVTGLLAAAPRLKVLATSREALRLTGEYEYLVQPLPVPFLQNDESELDLSSCESVSLFVQRAQAVSAGFQLTDEIVNAVARICRRLDGLPLAIELAAARIKLFSPLQLIERLDRRLDVLTGGTRDLPARQRTMRDTFDWSYGLLDEGEQCLLARLAVFNGGGTADSINSVCGPGLGTDALDGLESLLNKSLLYQVEGVRGEPRFMMLEIIREHAWERLVDSSEEKQMRDRHLDYFRALAEEMEPGYRQRNQLLLIDRTQSELVNLRAAFRWALDSGQVEAAARLVSSIQYFLSLRFSNNQVTGYRWLKWVLDRLEEVPLAFQGRTLRAAARLAFDNGDISEAKRLAEKALAISRDLGDRCELAWSLCESALASLGMARGQGESIKLCDEALTIFRELDNLPGIAYALNVAGELARSMGDIDGAREYYEKCLDICKKTGEIHREIFQLENLSFLSYADGDFEGAMELAAVATQHRIDFGWQDWAGGNLVLFVGPLAKLGKPEKAARLMAASEASREKLGVHVFVDQQDIDKYSAVVQAQLDKSSFEKALAEGRAMGVDEALAYALSE